MAKRKSTKSEDAEIEELFETVKSAPALFTFEQIDEWEKRIEELGWIRRAGYLFLSKNGAELLDQFQQDREAAVAIVPWYDRVGMYVDMLDSLKETIEAARARVAMAYAQREDMEAIFEEGRAEADAA